MSFINFIEQGKVMKGTPDKLKARSLLKMAKAHLTVIKKTGVNKENASMQLSQAYESLRQVLEAIALCEGFKVFSHEAFTFFLQEKGEEAFSHRFDRLRKLRNGINYYGKPVSEKIAEGAIQEIDEMIDTLEKRHLKHLVQSKK